jgi:hypothetical protein
MYLSIFRIESAIIAVSITAKQAREVKYPFG